MLFCLVQLLDATEKELTYRVPELFRSMAKVGMRVLVPLGNQQRIGIITRILTTLQKEREFKLKDIIVLLDDKPIITEDLMNLCFWISSYYVYPLGLTFASVLPEPFRKKPEAAYCLKTPDNLTLNNIFGKKGILKEKELVSSKKISPEELKELEQSGLIQKTYTFPAPYRRKAVMVALIASSEESIDFPADVRLLFKRYPEGIRLETLKHQLKENYNTFLRKAKKKGWISIVKREETETDEIILYQDIPPEAPKRLTEDQSNIIERLENLIEKREFSPFLLYGVTGSGKTEIYVQITKKVIDKGRSVLVLVPEIALITQMEAIFRQRFDKSIVAVWHSGIPDNIRYHIWHSIIEGRKRLVIGTRSSVFSPLTDCGLIIVDEEHDASYKQEDRLRFNGRDVAIKRAQLLGIPVILGSATPSLQSFKNAQEGRYELAVIAQRIHGQPLPDIEVVDMRQEKSSKIISRRLKSALLENFDRGLQSLLFLNRRGYSNYALCRRCGYVIYCSRCSIPLTYHREGDTLRCHYCGLEAVFPTVCPACEGGILSRIGFGTERIEEEVSELLPPAKILRIDRDAIKNTKELVEKLNLIRNTKVDVIIGTQMIIKGHDFPSISLTGVINADSALALSDFRSGETTAQQLLQVGGRSGRGGTTRGLVIIQTYNPNHYVIESATKRDYALFCEQELTSRKNLAYPPFSKMARILCESPDKELVYRSIHQLKKLLDQEVPQGTGHSILGPAPSPLYKIRNRYRWHIIVRTSQSSDLTGLLKNFLQNGLVKKLAKKTHIIIDRDPFFCL